MATCACQPTAPMGTGGTTEHYWDQPKSTTPVFLKHRHGLDQRACDTSLDEHVAPGHLDWITITTRKQGNAGGADQLQQSIAQYLVSVRRPETL